MIFPGLFSIGGEVGTDYQNIHKSQAILSVIFCATFYFLAVFYLALELRKSKVDTTSILREQAEDLNIQSVQEDRNNQTQSRHEMNDFNVLSTERLRIDDSEPFDILSQENIQMSSRRGLITPRETPEKHRRTFSPLNLDDLAGLRSPTGELANPFAESPSGQQVIRRFPEPARFNTLNATDSSFQSRSMSTINLKTQKMNSRGQESSVIKGDQYDLPNPPKSLLDLE